MTLDLALHIPGDFILGITLGLSETVCLDYFILNLI